jgi:hypothetical protein
MIRESQRAKEAQQEKMAAIQAQGQEILKQQRAKIDGELEKIAAEKDFALRNDLTIIDKQQGNTMERTGFEMGMNRQQQQQQQQMVQQ